MDTTFPFIHAFLLFHNGQTITDGIAWLAALKLVLASFFHHSLITCINSFPSILIHAVVLKYFYINLATGDLKKTCASVSSLGLLQHQHLDGNMYPHLLYVSSSGIFVFHNRHIIKDTLNGKPLTQTNSYNLFSCLLLLLLM